ncbi:MAG: Na+/H+ antiporter subunit E [Schwartzia sp.]|nr:Na+/H+ antiporter subunit E [Schwartzia sp. (in: firmicutes)]
MTTLESVRDKRVVGAPTVHLVSMTVLMFGFWMLLSGNTQPKFLTYGVLTSIIATWVSYPLLLVPNEDDTKRYFVFGVNPAKLVAYIVWLLWQLVLANVDVIRATVRPEIEIDPCVVRFRYQTDNPMAKVVLANSITLTPGTVTMNVTQDGLYEVHALTVGAAEGLRGGDMQKKVAWLFDEAYDFELLKGKN